jgi:hypothetical protein
MFGIMYKTFASIFIYNNYIDVIGAYGTQAILIVEFFEIMATA